MSSQNTPVLILKEGTQRSTSRDAQRNKILAAKVVASKETKDMKPPGPPGGMGAGGDEF